MNEGQWETEAGDLAAAHGSVGQATGGAPSPTTAALRRCLVEVDRLLRAAPTAIQQRYKAIPERRLRRLHTDVQAYLDAGTMRWLPGDPVEAAAAQVRALDQHLLQHRDTRGKPDDANSDYLCTLTNVHVVPRPLAKAPVEPDDVATMTYRRRGLVFHRLLPATTGDGYALDLQWHRDLSLSFRRDGAQVLAALFAGLTLEREGNFADFVAAGAPCSDEAATLVRQVKDAYAGDVVVALWPELTMPPSRRQLLVDELRRASLTSSPGKGPGVVAAGSWHEVSGRTVSNRMHVLSSAGRLCFSHDKSIPLESKKLGREMLKPSYRLPVLLGNDALIAFAICRDFCEAQISRLYQELDVDLVLVTSYGDVNTMRSHREQAVALARNHGTRTFVVQQVVQEEVAASGNGYVLPPEMDPGATEVAKLATNDLSRRHPISFKRV